MSRPVVAITGGGSGLGEGMALLFAESGYDIAICGRRIEKLEQVAEKAKASGAAVYIQSVDVRNYESVDLWLQKAREKFGQLDALICNAAGNFIAPSIELSPRAWKAVTEINMDGTFLPRKLSEKSRSKTSAQGRSHLSLLLMHKVANPGLSIVQLVRQGF